MTPRTRLAASLATLILGTAAPTLAQPTPTPKPEPELPAGFTAYEHESAALGRRVTYAAYVPPASNDATEPERFPTLYILHGATGGHLDWPTRTRLASLAEEYRLVLVCPDGGEYGWYLDSPVDKASQYETYVTRDLLADVEARLPVLTSEKSRAIMGLSMGGHGALSLAARHPQLYASASSLSGILRLTNHPDYWELPELLGPVEERPERWAAVSVYDLADRFATNGVSILFDCGVDDTATRAITDNRELHARLVELRIPHIWREHAGSHSWTYWDTHLPQHLAFHAAALEPLTPGLGKWQRHYYKRLAIFHRENAALALERPQGRTVALVGPSTIESLDADQFPGWHVYNRGVWSDNTGTGLRGVAWRLEECVFDMAPDAVIYRDGVNDLGDLARNGKPTMDQIKQRYEANVTTIRERLPRTQVVLTSSAPAGGRFVHLNPLIVEWNTFVADVARRHDLVFVNDYPLVVDPEGNLRSDLSNDGLHLNDDGQTLLYRALNEGLAQAAARLDTAPTPTPAP